ncbi:UNVERIFIED_CONTAM: hypothetical protein Sradi_6204200 [Sesamum radiatum]|uniref:Zinc finger, CCHC-type n=1 Tax=Sesamum radiatum TaxID=300843 RepID=A0AAW2K937_SESRA
MDAWVHGDFLCRNYILNDLGHTLYNVYSLSQNCKSPLGVLGKEIQNRGCRLEEIHSRNVVDIQNGGLKTVMNQVQEFQMILHDLHAEGMKLNESFQVAIMIKKLPPLWKDFKNYLKHKRKEMGLGD